jgi:hypothetical protein
MTVKDALPRRLTVQRGFKRKEKGAERGRKAQKIRELERKGRLLITFLRMGKNRAF